MNTRKTKVLSVKYDLPIIKVMVRGGTDHRKDLCLKDGTIMNLWKDGSMDKEEGLRWHGWEKYNSWIVVKWINLKYWIKMKIA